MLGLYLHLPFCVRRCHYCAFPVSTVITADAQEAYINKLLRDFEEALLQLDSPVFDTLYIGGGTPTLLALPLWERLFAALRPHLGACTEITVETNPESTTSEIMQFLYDVGVSRVSLGVQSINEHILRKLGRQHTPADIDRALDTIFQIGFQNVSADLILGLPGDDTHAYMDTLEFFAGYPLTHISGYFLMIKEGSAFAQTLPAVPSEEYTLESYKRTHEFLCAQGFERYEVSNWGKPGFACQHNMHTWEHRPYLGLGMGAESFVHQRRFVAPATMQHYLATPFPTLAHLTPLSREENYSETVLLGLRLRSGVSVSQLLGEFPEYTELFNTQCQILQGEGLLEYQNDRITTTEAGLLVLDHVTSQLLP